MDFFTKLALSSRAEREILRLSREEEISEWPLKYVNRLSDLLFVLSRWVSKNLSEPEYRGTWLARTSWIEGKRRNAT